MGSPTTWLTITFPAARLDPELIQLLEEEYWLDMKNFKAKFMEDELRIEDGLFTLQVGEAKYGEAKELEDMLKLKKISFDRENGQDYEIDAELVVFRPDQEPDIRTYPLSRDGDMIVSVWYLRHIIEKGEETVTEYLDRVFPPYEPVKSEGEFIPYRKGMVLWYPLG